MPELLDEELMSFLSQVIVIGSAAALGWFIIRRWILPVIKPIWKRLFGKSDDG